MVVVLAFGMEVMAAIETILIPKKHAMKYVLILLEKRPVIYLWFLVHVKGTIRGTGTLLTQGSVPSLLMEDASVTTTNSKAKRNVTTYVWKMSSSRCSQISVSRISNLDLVLAISPAGDTIKTPNNVRNLTLEDAKEI